MSASVFFSCVIPLFNKEGSIRSTIMSVLNQTYREFELIVVNDGSTDSSLSIVLELAKVDSRINIIDQANCGVSVARNIGISNSKGKYIAFLDGDDRWTETHLADLQTLAHKYPGSSILSTNFQLMTTGGLVKSSINGIDTDCEFVKVTNYVKSCVLTKGHLTGSINSSTGAIKRNVFDEMEGFISGIKNNEDLDLWLRVSLDYEMAFTWRSSVIIDRTVIQNRKLEFYDYRDNYIILSINQILKERTYNPSKKFWLNEYKNKKKLEFAKNLIFHNKKFKALKVLFSIITIYNTPLAIQVYVMLFIPGSLISALRKLKN